MKDAKIPVLPEGESGQTEDDPIIQMVALGIAMYDYVQARVRVLGASPVAVLNEFIRTPEVIPGLYEVGETSRRNQSSLELAKAISEAVQRKPPEAGKTP